MIGERTSARADGGHHMTGDLPNARLIGIRGARRDTIRPGIFPATGQFRCAAG